MGLCSGVAADLVEMHLHGARVGEWEQEGSALVPHGADGAEQVSVGVSLVGRSEWPGPCLRPDPRIGFAIHIGSPHAVVFLPCKYN